MLPFSESHLTFLRSWTAYEVDTTSKPLRPQFLGDDKEPEAGDFKSITDPEIQKSGQHTRLR
uniref:Uncharacterized protein n=1 Tax=Anguilla anguilla TaxID=7936 RepID=A0A0E9X851_ANGAN